LATGLFMHIICLQCLLLLMLTTNSSVHTKAAQRQHSAQRKICSYLPKILPPYQF